MSDAHRAATGRRLGALIPAGVFAGLAALLYLALFWGDPGELPSALIGKPVPEFDLPPVEGMAGVPGLASSDLAHGEVTVVNVWASWCAPCREEHPVLEALSVRLAREGGARLVGLNYKDAPENARRFLGALGNPFQAIGADRTGRVAIDWGVYGVPETFVVDGQGRIAFKHVGPISPGQLDGVIMPAIRAARAEPGALTGG